jgi:thymidine kinase
MSKQLIAQCKQANEQISNVLTTLANYERNNDSVNDELIEDLHCFLNDEAITQLNELLDNAAIVLAMSNTATKNFVNSFNT